jgi:predicted Zn-dependent peptidase
MAAPETLPRLTVLPSGLTVVTERMAHAATVGLGVWVAAGSRHEAAQEHGLAHALEHMAFKGTRRRSAQALAEEIEAVGGDMNAATSIEYTCYTARVMADDLPLAVDLISDILTEPLMLPDELEREKNVIGQEIAAVADTPDDLVYDLFMQTAYAGQGFGRPILGTAKSVAAMTPEMLHGYLNAHYTAGRMVFAATGAVDHDALVALVERQFAPFAGRVPPPEPPAARYVGGEIGKGGSQEQLHLVLGFEGASIRDQAHYPYQVLAAILGGGLSSRLFQELREKRGLAYAVDAFHWPFADTGLFGISLGLAPADTDEALKVMLECLHGVVEGATAAELQRAKAQMKVGLLASLETPSGTLEHLARQVMLHGVLRTRAEIAAAIDAMTLADVRRAGAAVLASKPTLAAVGPRGKLPRLERLGLARPAHAAS